MATAPRRGEPDPEVTSGRLNVFPTHWNGRLRSV